MDEFNANYFVDREDRVRNIRFLSVRYRCEIDICCYKLREDGNTIILIDAFFSLLIIFSVRMEGE